ncbi:MAG: GIY-YIG nuclease family protein [Eubacterium sp.]|nr:GIY-YIG nuclease family protein [Eubacterium sp.]
MLVTIVIFCIIIILLLHSIRPRTLRKIIKTSKEISIDEFLELRNKKSGEGKKLASEKDDVPGVYIIHNHSKRKYYVGQANKIISRANSHFTGKGNGRVYADYSYGDRFTIRFVPLKGSGIRDLNRLERIYIKRYKAYSLGYNRTKGNKK